jgi:acetyl esterase
MAFPSDALSLPDKIPLETAKLFKLNAERLAGQPDPTTLPAAEGRALLAKNDLFYNANPLPVDSVRDDRIGGVSVRRYKHKDAQPGVMLYIHGGGWAFGNCDSHDVATRALARSARVEVISVDYRLAPEHAHTAVLEDCVAVYRALVGNVMPASEIVLAGDSAGAHLCVLTMLALPELNLPMPAGACLFYGVYDDDTTTTSHAKFGPGGFGLTTARMTNYWNWYLPEAQRAHAKVRPIRDASEEALAALPPLWFTSAGLDCLKSDTLRMIDRLRAAGHVAHTHEEVLGVPHGHLLAVQYLKATRDLITICGAKVRSFLA